MGRFRTGIGVGTSWTYGSLDVQETNDPHLFPTPTSNDPHSPGVQAKDSVAREFSTRTKRSERERKTELLVVHTSLLPHLTSGSIGCSCPSDSLLLRNTKVRWL